MLFLIDNQQLYCRVLINNYVEYTRNAVISIA